MVSPRLVSGFGGLGEFMTGLHVRRDARTTAPPVLARACSFMVAISLLWAVASPALGLVPAASPASLPEFPGSSATLDLGTRSLPQLPLEGDAPDFEAVGAASTVGPSDVALPFTGGWYWVGEYLNIDGWVDNDTATTGGPVFIRFVVQTDTGVTLVDEVGVAAVYNLRPGESATFKALYHLPDHAGNTMIVGVETLAVQPTSYPSAVDLTWVSESYVTDADGVRLWTFTYRNDSAVTLQGPILGGVELDAAGDVFSTLVGANDAIIAPGQTVAIEAYGFNVADTPASVQSYCQAVPKRLDPVYRFFNRSNGTHFYTVSTEERDAVIARWSDRFTYEGVAYFTDPDRNAQPLYRFYYLRGGSHFYTASVDEANLVIARWPNIFRYEGPAYRVSAAQVPDSVTVYRFVNRKNSSHFYTASAEEAEMVKARWSSTYIYEGPAFWVAQ